MSSVFTACAIIGGAFVAQTIVGFLDDRGIHLGELGADLVNHVFPHQRGGVEDGAQGGAGARRGTVRTRSERQDHSDSDEEDTSGRSAGGRLRNLRIARGLGAVDINGDVHEVTHKDDLQVFYPVKAGPGGLVRVMAPTQAERFLKRLYSAAPKGQTWKSFLGDLLEENNALAQDNGPRREETGSIYSQQPLLVPANTTTSMPSLFAAQWPWFRMTIGSKEEVIEELLFSKFSGSHLVETPLLSCGGASGALLPASLQASSWAQIRASTSFQVPARTPEARQFLWTCCNNLKTFYAAVYHDDFASAFDAVLEALRGSEGAGSAVAKMGDLYLFMLLHGVLARWSTRIWTGDQGVSIGPTQAARMLAEMFNSLLFDISQPGRVEPYPHIDFFSQNGRFHAIMTATTEELQRRASAQCRQITAEVSARGGGSGGATNTTAVPAAAVAQMWIQQQTADNPASAVAPKSDFQGGSFLSPSGGAKGLCLKCVVRCMDIDLGDCLPGDRFKHVRSLNDVSTSEIERALIHLPKFAKGFDAAHRWLENRKKTGGK
jgi:hypothetical protein